MKEPKRFYDIDFTRAVEDIRAALATVAHAYRAAAACAPVEGESFAAYRARQPGELPLCFELQAIERAPHDRLWWRSVGIVVTWAGPPCPLFVWSTAES